MPFANRLAALTTDWMARCAEAAASIPGAAWEVEPWPPWAVALWYAVLAGALLVWRALGRRRRAS